jgi:hypothetical protein
MTATPAQPKSSALTTAGVFVFFLALEAFGLWDLFEAVTAGRIRARHGWIYRHEDLDLFDKTVFKAGLATAAVLAMLVVMVVRAARRKPPETTPPRPR